MEVNMISVRRNQKRDWTALYIIAFALAVCATYTFEREIEVNEIPLVIDYN